MVLVRMSLTDAPGFYPQPNEWTCGPFALKHALIALGKFVDATELASAAKTHWWSGTDEIRLARAAREHECDLVLERRRDPEEARKLLVRFCVSKCLYCCASKNGRTGSRSLVIKIGASS